MNKLVISIALMSICSLHATGEQFIEILSSENTAQDITRSAAWLSKSLRDLLIPMKGNKVETMQLIIWENPHNIIPNSVQVDLTKDELERIAPLIETAGTCFRVATGQRSNINYCVRDADRELHHAVVIQIVRDEILDQLHQEKMDNRSIATVITAARKLQIPEIERAATQALSRYLKKKEASKKVADTVTLLLDFI